MKRIVYNLFRFKTIMLFFFNMLLNLIEPNAQEVVSITTTSNSYIIDFSLPSYQVVDTNLVQAFGLNQNFSLIKIEDFGEMVDSGYPLLPQYTFDLHIPDDASNFNVLISEKQKSKIHIANKILPFQDIYKNDSLNIFAYDTNYYASDGSLFSFDYEISDTFIIMEAKGISFSIFPFHYNPVADSLEIIQSCRFTIIHNGSSSLLLKPDTTNSALKNHYLNNVFVNFPSSKSLTSNLGKYLIITDPDFESTLSYFANYKNNIGYSVSIYTTAATGTTTEDIKEFLQLQYNYAVPRPDFVLLVGDHDKIPASGGNIMGDVKNDPITDLNYARLVGSDYFADLFIGRLPVSTITELQNILNKTIYIETNIHLLDKKAKFLAGEESNNWMENQFENGHNYVIDYTFDPQGFSSYKLYQPNNTQAIDAINDNPLFYIYSGHGYFTYMAGGSFSIYNYDVNSATNSVFPFVFSFACKTGNFAYTYTCIGENWIRSNVGGVAYFGSSVNTMVNSDKAIEEKIFGDAFTDEDQISIIINLGMKRYWNRFWSFLNRKRTKRYIKAYNLLGDPSIIINGIGCIQDYVFQYDEVFNNGDIITYHAGNYIENLAEFEVNAGANVSLKAGTSLSFFPGLNIEAGAHFLAKIKECDIGTSTKSSTLITCLDDENYTFHQNVNSEPEIFSVFPNPANTELTITFTLKEKSEVLFELYNISGRKFNTHKSTIVDEGIYIKRVSISEFSPGIYFYFLETNSNTYTGKIIKI